MKHFIITIFIAQFILTAFAQNNVIIKVFDAEVNVGDEITYPITIDPNGNALIAFNRIEIEYDSNQFEITGLEQTDGWFLLFPPPPNTGMIIVAGFYEPNPFDPEDVGQTNAFELINITFKAIGQPGETSQIQLNTDFGWFDNNEQMLTPLSSDGSISINGCDNTLIGTACDDGNACTTGETYDANCNCTDGTSQVGMPCNDNNACTINDVYDANCLCVGTSQAGMPCNDNINCTINDSYDSNCQCVGTPTNTCSDCELLSNTNFDDDLSSWDYWGCDATATNGVSTITNIANGQEPWETSFYSGNLLIEQGENYEIKFTAWADASRNVVVKVGQNDPPFLNYHLEDFNLTTNRQDFSTSFTMADPMDGNSVFNFFIGGNTTNIYVDDVSLVKTNCCSQQGENCDDGDVCTTGETLDADCNCVGGIEIPECGPCRYTDSLALVAVYNGLNGNDWSPSRQWDFTQPMDTWRGVGLNANGCVDWISIEEGGVTGVLAPEIGNLSEITSINLHENSISGAIPAAIGNLTNLKWLNMDDNNLNESIPSTIGNLTNLTHLNLGRNSLEGPIPSSIGNLINLENLNLYINNLTDIPISIGDLQKVENIFLSQNNINNLPSSIGNLPELILLDLRDNNLTSIPTTIGSLNKLDKLWLNDNQLSTLPASIGNLNKLSGLNIYNNQITGNMPAWLGNLNNLKQLQMFNNQFSGCYNNSLAILCDQLSYTSNYNISDGNNFTAPWEDFCATGTCISQTTCRQTDSLALVAVYNALNGDNWYSFYQWDLTQPMDIWRGITLNSNGCVDKVDMDERGITGTLPTEIGNLSEITMLDFEENNISGPIPASIGSLTNLKVLALRENQLSGDIPFEIGDLTNLETLDLSTNQLTGNIPPTIGGLTNLRYLNLAYNNMSGCFYPTLSPLCSQLTFADIDTGNDFTISTGDFCSGATCSINKTGQPEEIDTRNYPNPFTDHTTIEYVLSQESKVTLTVYDGMGKQVAMLYEDEKKQAGKHSINFNGSNYPPGIYYYALRAGDYIKTQKMILMR